MTGKLFCNMDIDEGRWTLYLVNGNDAQHKPTLRLGSNSTGFGDWYAGNVKTVPKSSGGYKLSEESFDKHNFTNYEFIAGDITETVPAFVRKNGGMKVSLLNIDCDFVEPTYAALKHFWPIIPRGGIVLLDNYGGSSTEGHSYYGDTKGVDDFIKELEVKPIIKKFPWVCRPCYIVKE